MTESTTAKGLLAFFCLTIGALQPAFANNAFFIEGGVGAAEFDETVFEGDGNLLTVSLGYRFDIGSELGGRPSLEVGLMSNSLFNIDTSRGDDDDVDDFSVSTLYFRYDQQLADKVSGFGQIGYSSLEVKTTSSTCTGFIFPDCTTTTDYRNKDSGISWGVGLNFRTSPDYLLSVGYFDYSESDIDLTTWMLTLRREMSW